MNKLFRYIEITFLYFKNLLKISIKDWVLKRTYLSFCDVPNFSKPYIYVPLHYQPEMTTSPLGGIFVNQELMLHMISKAIPEDTEIIIKEHPTQWLFMHRGRTRDFYIDLKKLEI